MSPQRILGIALLAAGVVFLVIGMNSSHSVADQLSNTFTGRFTDNTQWYILGGIITGIVGLAMMLLGPAEKIRESLPDNGAPPAPQRKPLMIPPLNKQHQQTYDAIFQHPIPHNLHRRDVMSLLSALAEITEEPNGNSKITRNGQTLVLHASRDKNVAAMDELQLIRRFLEQSGDAVETPAGSGHFLVVIDHREARIYKTELHGALPERITPFDPHGYGRNLHYVQDDASGQRKPELKSFYEAVAKTLQTATEILMFGSATGASSAMVHLREDLKKNHPDVARHVVASVALDAQHLTEGQLLAKAREFYEMRALTGSAA